MAREDTVVPFVGESRHLMVDGLVDVYEAVKSSGESCWVSLEAGPGWGKTRLGRELYARLAERQGQPRYWPVDLRDPSRKVTNPGKFDRPAGSLPEYLWWGISCSARNDLPTNSLRHDLEQLEWHATHVEDAWQKSTLARQRWLTSLVATGRALTIESAMTLAAEAAVATIGFSTGLGPLVRGVGHVHKTIKETGARKTRTASGGPVGGDETNDIVDDTIEILGRVAETGFPIVLLIEDLHLADVVLIEFIDKLLTSVTHVLVLTTAWPGKIDEHRALDACIRKHEQKVYRVDHMGAVGEPFPAGASLAALDTSSMESVVRSYFPEVAPGTLSTLLERYSSPWELELICRLPKHQKQHPKLEISAKSLLKLPKDLKALHREHWEQLPENFQLGLATAYVIVPKSINQTEAGGMNDWDHSLLDEIVASLEIPDLDLGEFTRQVDETNSAYGWVRAIDHYLRSFVEAAQMEIASDDGAGLLEGQLDDAREEILNHLATMTQIPLDGSNSTHRARTILSLHAEGYIKDTSVVANAIEAVLADLEDAPRELDERCRLFEKFQNLAKNSPQEIPNETSFNIRYHGATALGEARRVDDAITTHLELLTDQQRILGMDHPDTLTSHHNLAHELANAGRVEEAITEWRRILADSRRILQDDHPDTLMSWASLADELGSAGRVEESLSELRKVLAAYEAALGIDHSDTLNTRHLVACRLGEAGHREEALSVLRQVLADRERVLGDSHQQTLITRYEITAQLGYMGLTGEAIIELRRLLADEQKILGDKHPDTLTTRHDIAFWLGTEGRHEEAIAAYRDLLADREKILGSDDHHTLKTRGLLANEIGNMGCVEEAIAMYRDLLPVFRRKLTGQPPRHADCPRLSRRTTREGRSPSRRSCRIQ